MKPWDRTAQWQWEQNEFLEFVNVKSTNGYSHHIGNALLGMRWSELKNQAPDSVDWNSHFELIKECAPFFNFEFPLVQPDGTFVHLSLCGVPVNDANGNFMGYRGIGKDITSQKAADETIASLTLIDQLTGLSNRRQLLERINFARLSGFRNAEFGALIYVDIDHFKAFNEAVGHDLADVLLVEIGGRLANCMRDCDTVARLGGDVFVLLSTDLGNTSEKASQSVQRITQKISDALQEPFTPAMDIALTVSPQAPRFSACLGISLFQGTEEEVEGIMKHAESALREAKTAGRGAIRYFDPRVDARINHRLQIEKDLHIAIKYEQLCLYYQPILNLARDVIGYEALIRWQHPIDGILTPAAFIEIAEETGLIVPMGEWVILSACEQLKLLQKDSSTQQMTIAINLSAVQLAQPDIVDVIARIIKTTNAPANRLKLEITESMLLKDIEKTIGKMVALTELGLRFSLDDFGTGYSSLGYLKKLPLSQLKVDQSFVKGVLTDPVDSAIVRTIIQLAKSLGMSVIAEGVELEGQFQVLSQMGCKEFQGYLFGKPAPLK